MTLKVVDTYVHCDAAETIELFKWTVPRSLRMRDSTALFVGVSVLGREL